METKFNSTKTESLSSSNKAKQQKYIIAELELIRADTAIKDVETAMKIGKSLNEVDSRIKRAQ